MCEQLNMLFSSSAQEMLEVDIKQSQPLDLICPICDCHYQNEKQFYGHLHVHTKDVKWKCMQCPENNMEFDSQSKLKLHENLYHNIARPFKCNECDLTFDRASQYDYHHRSIHLGEKSQLCEICGKGFFRKTDLQTHLNIHSGNNLCICEVCGKRFNHISNLIRHCRMHAGVKPYPCSICGKRFTQISSLVRHKRIHERSMTKLSQMLPNNEHTQEADQLSGKDKSVEGSTPNHRRVIKRQRYCKVCGESFDLILLLRQHEKIHKENESLLECKDCKKTFQKLAELREHKCSVKCANGWDRNLELCQETKVMVENKEINRPESDVKKVVPLENIIYITSEQQPPFTNDGHILLCKSNDPTKNAGIIYIRQLDKNNIAILPQNVKVDVSFESHENGKIIHGQSENVAYDNKQHNNLLSTDENPLYTEILKSEVQKPDDLAVCNLTVNIPVNVNQVLQKSDQGTNLDHNEKSAEDSNQLSDTANHEEPMLRLVQTETGEQFYEFVISNPPEKPSNVPFIRASDRNSEEVSNRAENTENECNSEQQIQHEQDLHSMTDIHDDLNYTHYDLHGEEKNFSGVHHGESESLFCTSPKSKEYSISAAGKETNSQQSVHQELLGNDAQAEFDRYVEANFEVFERLNYDNSSERFLELVEIAEGSTEVPTYKESSASCFVPNESEQFLELLHGCQTDKSEVQSFNEIDCVQNGDSISDNSNDKDLLTYMKGNEDDEINKNSTETEDIQTKNREEESRDKSDDNDNASKEDTPRESKKSKSVLLKFQCMVCEKSFSTNYNYKQHIGTHFADQQKFHCKDCGMNFAWKSTLNKHMANYHRPDGPQRFVCSLCPKVYSTSSQVNEHVKRDHWKHLNHVCSQCGKSFFKKYDLKIHSRTHTGERPYVCRVCGKRFHHRSHIIRHERIHL